MYKNLNIKSNLTYYVSELKTKFCSSSSRLEMLMHLCNGKLMNFDGSMKVVNFIFLICFRNEISLSIYCQRLILHYIKLLRGRFLMSIFNTSSLINKFIYTIKNIMT